MPLLFWLRPLKVVFVFLVAAFGVSAFALEVSYKRIAIPKRKMTQIEMNSEA